MKAVFSLAALISAGAVSAEVSPNPAQQFVEHFAVYCAGNPGSPDKTAAMAKLQSLELVGPDILAAFGPQDHADEVTGWYITNADQQKVLLAVTKSNIANDPVATCTIFGNRVIANDVIDELHSWMDLPEPTIDQTSFGNRMRLWRTEMMMMEPVRLMLANPSDTTISGVTLGVVAQLVEN